MCTFISWNTKSPMNRKDWATSKRERSRNKDANGHTLKYSDSSTRADLAEIAVARPHGDRPGTRRISSTDKEFAHVLMGNGVTQSLNKGRLWEIKDHLTERATQVNRHDTKRQVSGIYSHYSNGSRYDQKVLLYDIPLDAAADEIFVGKIRSAPVTKSRHIAGLWVQNAASSACSNLKQDRPSLLYRRPSNSKLEKNGLFTLIEDNKAARARSDKCQLPRVAAFDRMISQDAGIDIEKYAGKYVEVDLGEEHYIRAISTQGQQPRTYRWPTEENLERHGYQSKWLRKKKGLQYYEGNYYTCMDRNNYNNCAWVTKYKVLIRRQGGRGWMALGTFKGNSNFYEVVRRTLVEEVRARYVRFVPLQYHKTPVMRVGIYGTLDENSAEDTEKSTEMGTVRYCIREGPTIPDKTIVPPSTDSYWESEAKAKRRREKVQRERDIKYILRGE